MPYSGCSALHGVNPGLKKLFFGHFGPFLPFYCPPNPPTILKIKIKKKINKMPGDIVLLHMCTINEDHTIYGS